MVIHIDGLVQDCSNSIANAMELLQSCTKPSICAIYVRIIALGKTENTNSFILLARFLQIMFILPLMMMSNHITFETTSWGDHRREVTL